MMPSKGIIENRVLSIILILAVVGTLGTLVYVVANPTSGEKFTEFYLLGLNGKATDYPKELSVGEEGEVILGIINQEREPLTYRVEILIDDVKNSEVGPMALEYGGKWEGTVSFTPNRVGDNEKVEFLLYRQDQTEVYQELHLWVDVIEAEEFKP
jgi:uncharacterized membrane protein